MLRMLLWLPAGLLLAIMHSSPSSATTSESWDKWKPFLEDCDKRGIPYSACRQRFRDQYHRDPPGPRKDGPDLAAIPATSESSTYSLTNVGTTLSPGEPTAGGRMTKTVWANLNSSRKQRVVLLTFGSEFDTVLAAYRGNGGFSKLKRVGVNDNFQVAGAVTTQSLIQFDMAAGPRYNIQIGGKNNAEGDLRASLYTFPPTGGLVAFLATVGGIARPNHDHVCQLGYASPSACDAPTFVVYNSTDAPLKVTPTATLAGAFSAPAGFDLGARKAKAVQFDFDSGFDVSESRTVSGTFAFTGKQGAKTVARAEYRGLIVVKKTSEVPPDVLRFTVRDQIRSGLVTEPIAFDVRVKNTGGRKAVGCHVRGDFLSKSTWRKLDPNSGALGPVNQPVTIPSGGFQWLRVTLATQVPRNGAPEFLNDIKVDCANTAEAPVNTQNRFDFTAFSIFDPADIVVTSLAPSSDTLDVPASGTAKFRVKAVNKHAPGKIRVFAGYDRPFDDTDTDKQFVVKGVCKSNAAGKCQTAIRPLLTYDAETGATDYFVAFVKAPPNDPGFDPEQRRIFFRFNQKTPAGVSDAYVRVGTRSVAVRKLP